MICPLAIAHTDDENWVHHDARIAELEAEVERLRAELLQERKDWVIAHEIRSG